VAPAGAHARGAPGLQRGTLIQGVKRTPARFRAAPAWLPRSRLARAPAGGYLVSLFWRDGLAELLEQAFGLLTHLLAAPGDDQAWRRFLAALCGELSGEVCGFLGCPARDRPGTIIAHGVEIGRSGILELGVPEPPLRLGIDSLEAGSVFSIPADAEGIARHTIFRNFLAAQGVRPGPGLGVVLERNAENPTCAILLLPGKGGWRPSVDDRALLECIAPHLVQARRLHADLSQRSGNAEALLAVFNRLLLGVILLDKAGRVSYANRSAAQLLGQPPGLAHASGLAKTTDPRTNALRRFMGTERPTSSGALAFPHPEDDRPLQMFATPLSWPRAASEARERFVRALFIGDPSRTSGQPTDVLRGLYGLTQSESRLAILLATDHSLAETAEHLGITISTARSVLKTVFAKTGTNRQASLVRLLVTGPWQVRAASRDASSSPS